MKIGGVGNLGVSLVDVAFLVVLASAWLASPNVRAFWVVILARRARFREGFKRGIIRKLCIQSNRKYVINAWRTKNDEIDEKGGMSRLDLY